MADKAFTSALTGMVSLLEGVNASSHSIGTCKALLALVSAKSFDTKTTLDRELQISSQSETGPTGSDGVEFITAVLGVVQADAPKRSVDRWQRFVQFLEKHRTETLVDIQYALDTAEPVSDLAKSYADRLMKSLGHPEFDPVFEQLKSDRCVRKADLVEILGLMGSTVAKSETKAALLERLASRHRSLSTYRAKAAAMDGRSAA